MASMTYGDEYQVIRNRRKTLYVRALGIILLGAALGISIIVGGGWFGGRADQGYEMNLVTEMIGVLASTGITIFIVDWLNEFRTTQQLKRRLVHEVCSRSNDVAISAIESMLREVWIQGEDSLLKGAGCWGANLQGAALRGVNLEGIILEKANLQGANLFEANLQSAYLYETNLQGAILAEANLQGAELYEANLRGAILTGVNLQGAEFFNPALVETTYLEGAAILPDGTMYTKEVNMEKFTDSRHPEFVAARKKVNEIRSELGYDVWV